MRRTINIVKKVKVIPSFSIHSKEEEKKPKSEIEKPKPKKHKPISNNNPSFLYNV
jgi:hypothetical protein